MLSHLMLGTNDLEASRRFYDAVLATLGAQPAVKLELGGLTRYLWTHHGTHLMVAQPRDGQPATHANGFTLGLQAQSEEQVQAALQAALAHGGGGGRPHRLARWGGGPVFGLCARPGGPQAVSGLSAPWIQ